MKEPCKLKLKPTLHESRVRKYFIQKYDKAFYKRHAKKIKIIQLFYMRDKKILKIISHKKYVIYYYERTI